MTPQQLLRWYPPSWRERYGDEFVACVTDTIDGDARVPLAMAARIAGAGLRERAHHGGVVGRADARTRVRAGSLTVLTGWAVFVLGGAAFAKRTEELSASLGRNAVAVLSLVGSAALLIGAVAVAPAIIRHLRSGGWQTHRLLLLATATVTVVLGASTAGLTIAARTVPAATRVDGSGWYGAAFGAWCLVVAAAIACWTTVAWVLGSQLDLTRSTASVERVTSTVVTVTMLTISVIVAAVLLGRGSAAALADNAAILVSLAAADGIASYGLSRALVRT